MTKKDITEFITRINGTYVFDVDKYLGFDLQSEDLKHFYKYDVESFFNSRKGELFICPNCGSVDSKENLTRMTIHRNEECRKKALIHYVWFKMSFWERWFPYLSYLLGNMEVYYKKALRWSELNTSRMYSIIIQEQNSNIINSWDIKPFPIEYSNDKFEEIEDLISNFKYKNYIFYTQYT